MNIGTQVMAKDGLGELNTEHPYTFLKTDPASGWATLVEFTTQTKGRRVHIHRLSRDVFLKAVDTPAGEQQIIVAPEQLSLPPWLSSIEGADLDELDLVRKGGKIPFRARTEQRYGYIAELLPRLHEILSAKNPFTIINAHARAMSPRQNRERLAEWFFAYVCYKRKLIALFPEFPNIGTYDKSDPKYSNTHFGVVSIHLSPSG